MSPRGAAVTGGGDEAVFGGEARALAIAWHKFALEGRPAGARCRALRDGEVETRLTRWVPRRSAGQRLSAEAEAREDRAKQCGIGQGRDRPHRAVTPGAAQGIEAVASFEQDGPFKARRSREQLPFEDAFPVLRRDDGWVLVARRHGVLVARRAPKMDTSKLEGSNQSLKG